MDDNWQPKKMDVEVEVPLTLDLESLRSNGMQVRKRWLLLCWRVPGVPSSLAALVKCWCNAIQFCVVVVYSDAVSR